MGNHGTVAMVGKSEHFYLLRIAKCVESPRNSGLKTLLIRTKHEYMLVDKSVVNKLWEYMG